MTPDHKLLSEPHGDRCAKYEMRTADGFRGSPYRNLNLLPDSILNHDAGMPTFAK